MNLELVSFATAAGAAACLAITLIARPEPGRERGLLIVALLLNATWASLVAYQSTTHQVLLLAQALEALRGFAWLAFLLAMLRTAFPREVVGNKLSWALGAIAGLSAGLILLAFLGDTLGARFALLVDVPLISVHLLLAIGGLVAVEQVYRNTPMAHRRAMKYLCIAIGGMFAYDFYLYADALLLNQIDPVIWTGRGFAHALVIPILGVATGRQLPWSLADQSSKLLLSRRAVLRTTALAGSGLYLLLMAAGGYYVRSYGGNWGTVAQLIFFFGALLVLAVLLFSGQLRAHLNVFISKHFFRYKYDYREEWLRFIRTLSSEMDTPRPHERAIRAIAQIMASPGGALWVRSEHGRYEPLASWNWLSPVSSLPAEPDDSSMVALLQGREWVINLDEHGGGARLGRNVDPDILPEWLHAMKAAWLVVPLILHQRLFGFVVLLRSPINAVNRHFNWEDCDLLKTAGRGAASYLAEVEASRALGEAREFEAFNRLSAFVVHDIKGLISQLSLVVANASRHRHNPEFLEDAIGTVENSIDKMNRLLTNLASGGESRPASEYVDLADMLSELVHKRAASQPSVHFECRQPGLGLAAERDRLGAVIGHVLQNARDATPVDGKIQVRLYAEGSDAVIEVEDSGCGMDEAFVRERLFRPFSSTKQAGMGIGMYETREFIRSLGGRVDVHSRLGIGTTIRLYFPLSDKDRPPNVYRYAAGATSTRWQPKPQSYS